MEVLLGLIVVQWHTRGYITTGSHKYYWVSLWYSGTQLYNDLMLPLQPGTQKDTKAQRNIDASCPDEQNSTNGKMAQMAAGPQWHRSGLATSESCPFDQPHNKERAQNKTHLMSD